jgi:hypothetical protein
MKCLLLLGVLAARAVEIPKLPESPIASGPLAVAPAAEPAFLAPRFDGISKVELASMREVSLTVSEPAVQKAPAPPHLELAREVLTFAMREAAAQDILAASALGPAASVRIEPVERRLVALYEGVHGPVDPILRDKAAQAIADVSARTSLIFHPRASSKLSALQVVQAAAADRAEARYALESQDRAKRLFERYFPGFYKNVATSLKLESGDRNGSHIHAGGVHILSLKGHGATHFNEDSMIRLDGKRGSTKRISAMMIMIHEYAHAVFADAAEGASGDKTTAYGALTEGFAVLLELIAADRMLSERQFLGLTDADEASLRDYKNWRLAELKKNKDHYTEGTLNFWAYIHRRGGLDGVRRFLRRIEGHELLVPRKHPVYQLVEGSPELAEAVFAGGVRKLRLGVLMIADFLDGNVEADAGQLAIMRETLGHAREAALRKVMRRYVKAWEAANGLKPGRVQHWHPAFRLAELDARAARSLAMADEAAAEFHSSNALIERAILDGFERLPLTESERRRWRSGVLAALVRNPKRFSPPTLAYILQRLSAIK